MALSFWIRAFDIASMQGRYSNRVQRCNERHTKSTSKQKGHNRHSHVVFFASLRTLLFFRTAVSLFKTINFRTDFRVLKILHYRSTYLRYPFFMLTRELEKTIKKILWNQSRAVALWMLALV